MADRLMKMLVLLAFATQPVLAQTLIPATSEDINAFDRQVAEQLSKSKSKSDKSTFGAKVSEEAKRLKDAGADKGKEFGKWVSSQRKKADQGRPSAQGSAGSGNSAGRGNSTAPHGPPDGK